jgi:hypothetical protein
MKYGECTNKVEKTIADVIDEQIEDGTLLFEEDTDRAILQVKLTSEITSFIAKYFGLEGDK